MNLRSFKFVKDIDSSWYIDLPEWEGDRSDLQMVSGADTMLDIIAQGEDVVHLYISDELFAGSDKIFNLKFIRKADELNNGAYYNLHQYGGIEMNLEVWLCDVTKFVFGHFPDIIYIAPHSFR